MQPCLCLGWVQGATACSRGSVQMRAEGGVQRQPACSELPPHASGRGFSIIEQHRSITLGAQLASVPPAEPLTGRVEARRARQEHSDSRIARCHSQNCLSARHEREC